MNDTAGTPTAKAIAKAAADSAGALSNDELNALRSAFEGSFERLASGINNVGGLIDAIPEAMLDDITPLRRVKVPVATGLDAAAVTAQLQSEIDGPERGIPFIGPGIYASDTLRSLRLSSGQIVLLHPAAILRAIPHGEEESFVVLADGVNDAVWIGGAIVGERDGHKYPTFNKDNRRTTHEWNHGLRLRKCNRVLVRGLSVSMCGGDGISAGGDDITLDRVTSTRNRRQGLTVGGSNRMRVLRSEFSETGNLPLADGRVLPGAQLGPNAGVDVEPDLTDVVDLLIEACIARNNQKSGFLFYAGSSDPVDIAATVRGCISEGNSNQFEAQATTQSSYALQLLGNTIRRRANSGVGIKLLAGGTATIGSASSGGKDMNVFYGPPGTDRADFVRNGMGSNTTNDIQRATGATANALWNAYK